MKPLLLASALSVLTFSIAQAADVYIPVAQTYDWSGIYIGAQAGHAWGSAEQVFSGGDYSHPSPDGFMGGIYAGGNYQLANNLVLGLDIDAMLSSAKGSSPFFYPGGIADTGPFLSALDMNWTAAGRVRIGYAIDRWLPYIATGVTASHGKYRYISNDPLNRADNGTYVGWTIGAGSEYALTDNLIFRGEYRYSDFGDKDFPSQNGIQPMKINLKTHDIRLGIAYKF